ncbi:hypothetical protein [Neobacillus terrae]|uniref:hypothetical protein n=1 Tax=Neobacillus terrae TaxID=3034837 RepID=UPI00140C8E30|nr:hypothetical protein [Neobacillus terrae]NHM33735.1 hypothetical protein [Neobacillus terrae]
MSIEKKDKISKEKINKMLGELMYFSDCQITHTFTDIHTPFSLSINKQKNEIYFQITFTENKLIELYKDISSATLALHKLLNNE